MNTVCAGRVGVLWKPLVIVFGVLAVAVVGLIFFGSRRALPEVGAECRSNMTFLHVQLGLYAADHGGNLPRSLAELYDPASTERRHFICPSIRRSVAVWRRLGGQDGPARDVSIYAPEKVSYLYVSGLALSDNPQSVVLFEEDGNHAIDGLNVLFLSGQIKWMSSDELRSLLEQQQAAAQKAGRQPKIFRGTAEVSLDALQRIKQ